MIKRDKVVKVTSKGTRYVVQPEHIKREAVRALENGELTMRQAMKKYELNRQITLVEWLKKYSSTPDKYFSKPRLSVSLKKQIVRQIELETLTIKEASNKYGIVVSAVRYWLKKYSCDITTQNTSQKMLQEDKDLAKQLAKIAALETMIDIAEESFNIGIRKKSGTKQ